mgnify:CR=1 FL=1
MYKVFVNDVPIILSTEKYIGENYTSIPIKRAKIKSIIKQVNRGQLTPGAWADMILFDPDVISITKMTQQY